MITAADGNEYTDTTPKGGQGSPGPRLQAFWPGNEGVHGRGEPLSEKDLEDFRQWFAAAGFPCI